MAESAPAPARRPGAGPDRPTLGLVTANIHLGVGATLWAGVLSAAERNDVNLVCFPGGPLSPGGPPRSALYDLVGPERLDGVVCWTSTLGLPAADDAGAARLMRRLADLPVVSLNRALDGHETLLLDGSAGMRQAVDHLVRGHGRHRIACLQGPSANPVSRDRHRAYADALARHRIRPDRALAAAAPGFGSGAGASAMRVLLDVRGLRPGRDFDAVVACSDVLAADALRLLAERGVRVPEEVAVIGFNDSLEARLTDPPLTSVALPFAELGALAVDRLLARLRGTAPPARSVVPGTLVVRHSCGCPSPLRAQGAWPDGEPAAGTAADPSEELFLDLPGPRRALAAALLADVCGTPPGGAFLGLAERLIGRRVHTADQAAAWDRALLRARDLLAVRLPPASRAPAERILGQARLMATDKAHRLLEYERWAEQEEARRLRELGTALSTAVDLEALTGVLARHLPCTGVPGCDLVLREDGPHPAGGPGRGAARLVPRGGPHPAGAPYPAALLLPDEALPGHRFTLVAECLHTGGEQFGFALFDAGSDRRATRRGALYRALGDQISAALKGIRLFDEVRRARDAAEQANRFKTRLLDNATDELRTPVETILRHTRTAGGAPAGPPPGAPSGPPAGASSDTSPEAALHRAHDEAARLLRLIDDLLDLSRSEIDALDLSRCLLNPRPVLAAAFRDATAAAAAADWRLELPRRLPALHADGPRLRQTVLNLLTAAGRFAGPGQLVLTAEIRPALLRVRITAPGLHIPPEEAEHLFQPFASGGPGARLGPAIARRLAVLHGGSVSFLHGPAGGCFRLDLPLPAPTEQPGPAPAADHTLLVAAASAPPPEAADLARRHGLRLHRVPPDSDLDALAARGAPAAVVWDADGARPQEWSSVQRLHDHPTLRRTPFLLYGPVAGPDLAGALRALRPAGLAEPAVVVDACGRSREHLRRLLASVLPGRAVRTAASGAAALNLLAEEAPRLLVVSRTLPDMDGFDVADGMRGGAGRAAAPVLVLDDRGFHPDDLRRAEPHPSMLFLGRGVLTDAETAALLAAMAGRGETGASRARGPVRHALVYLEHHYRRQLTRWQVARACGVSEDHLSRLFHREIGVTLWEYLTRLRIRHAKERLRRSSDSVQAVARAVGFHDRAYFSRVFRRVTGMAPHTYREAS